MNCPSCLQEVPGQPARCPFCQASLHGVRPAIVEPPRARDRDVQEEAVLRARRAEQDARGALDGLAERVRQRIPLSLRRLPHGEVWLSVLVPGLGHLALGLYWAGLLIMAGAALMLWMLVSLAMEPTRPDTTWHLFWFGLMLGLCHSHVMMASRRKFPDQPGWSTRTVSGLIIIALFAQLNLLGWAIYGREYQLDLRGVRLTGYAAGYFKPVLQGGDILEVNPIRPGTLERGDLVMLDQFSLDRVLGLEGDVLTRSGSEILRNGQPLPGSQQPVLGFNPGREIPYQLSQTPVTPDQSSITVGPGKLGLLFWGRHLRTYNIASLPGRIDGVLHPAERACRFVRGVRTNR